MAPTIQTGVNNDRDHRPSKTSEKRCELICRVKYSNTLPDIPFDPKFLVYPFESNSYNPTSLERNYKFELLTEHDLGVVIDLINPDTYAVNPNQTLDAADEKLLEEDIMIPQDVKRSRHHAKSVSWLRRTEYISTEHTRFQPQVIDKVEAKVGYNVKKLFNEETLYMDRESQIAAIEKTFQDAQKTIRQHYSKPNVFPVEILPIFPDFEVIFDSDPAPAGRSLPAQLEEMSQAMIRGVMDESGEQFVAYFLPTSETLEKRRRDSQQGCQYADEEEYDYKMAREYNWNVKNKASRGYEENYFFVIRADGVYYNELETRVRLSKRRLKPGAQPNNSRLVVRHRPLSAQEFKMHRYREKQLEPPAEDEEDEDEEGEDAERAEDEGSDGQKEDNQGRDSSSEKAASSSENSDAESHKSQSSSQSQSSSPSNSSQADDSDEQHKKNENEIFGSDTD